ncbi:MAG TPA: hypothetical protein VI299_03805, partial [Polyangiales bacterium]
MSAVAELDRQASPASDIQSKVSSESTPIGGDPVPSEAQLLDVLYEILAQGPAPKSKLTREQVERFLHEHARKTKPVSELVQFFREHDLPLMQPEEYGSDRELLELASGLQRERTSLIPGFGGTEPEEPATLPPATLEAIRREAQPAVDEAVSTGKHAAVSVPVPAAALPKRVHWAVWAAAALLLLALGAGLTVSHMRATALESKLDQARIQQKSTDFALTKLEQRAETLQGELKQSDLDRRTQQTRF